MSEMQGMKKQNSLRVNTGITSVSTIGRTSILLTTCNDTVTKSAACNLVRYLLISKT